MPDADAAFRFDLSFGPPPPYRLAVLQRALEVLGPGLLQFGSDCFLPCSGAQIAERRGWLEALLDESAVDTAPRAQIMGGMAAAWLRRPPTPPRPPAPPGPDTALREPAPAVDAHAAQAAARGSEQPRYSLWSRGWSPVCC
ncbi:MAG: hypothetical protein LH480_06350 [Rubrivivax sp.]|nr:hypothetical protein [Rubrivivax sp.]